MFNQLGCGGGFDLMSVCVCMCVCVNDSQPLLWSMTYGGISGSHSGWSD